MANIAPRALPDLSKLEPLDGSNYKSYKRWSQKLLIFLEALEVDYVLFHKHPLEDSESAGISSDNVSPQKLISIQKAADDYAKAKFEKDNKTVRGHLLNHMTDTLFDLFVKIKSAKQIWEALVKKYGRDDAGRKRYVVGKWLQFAMVDDQPIMDQVLEYENLTAEVLDEGMKMCDIFQANVLLEKFPPSWSDYRNQLTHKKRDLTLQELVSRMRTEEASRLEERKPFTHKDMLQKKQNLVHDGSRKITKPAFSCFICGNPGHKAYQCYQRAKSPHQMSNKPADRSNLAETDETNEVVDGE